MPILPVFLIATHALHIFKSQICQFEFLRPDRGANLFGRVCKAGDWTLTCWLAKYFAGKTFYSNTWLTTWYAEIYNVCHFVYHLSQSSICKIESCLLCSHCKRKRTSHLTSSPAHPPKVIRSIYLSLYKEQEEEERRRLCSKHASLKMYLLGREGIRSTQV